MPTLPPLVPEYLSLLPPRLLTAIASAPSLPLLEGLPAMSEADVQFLRGVELRLLRCTLSPASPSAAPAVAPPPSSSHAGNSLRPLIESVVAAIERGSYAEALSSDAARVVFPFADSWVFADTIECAGRFYGEVESRVSEFLQEGCQDAWLQCVGAERDGKGEADGEEDVTACRAVLVMCIGVAALLAFLQRNMTGPIEDFCPFPLLFSQSRQDKALNGGEWDVWARSQLTSSGCDVLGKFPLLQYIVYARILLNKIRSLMAQARNSCQIESKSISWWLCRLALLHQRILDDLSSSLYDLLQVLISETLLQFGSLENINNYWGSDFRKKEALRIISMAHLEAGIVAHAYGRVDHSGMHLKDAERACGLSLSVTGVLGFRTVHQVEAKSQLVLVAETKEQRNSEGNTLQGPEVPQECSAVKSQGVPESQSNHEDCDILMTPRLLESSDDAGVNGKSSRIAKMPLTAEQQAIILTQCLHAKKSNPDDELSIPVSREYFDGTAPAAEPVAPVPEATAAPVTSGWEVAPFIEAIDAQQQTYFIIRCFCDILRIRWESTRSRTKQRALLMMDKLVDCICRPVPSAVQRIYFSFGVYIPTIPSLRKEYGRLLVSNGMIGEALKTFEDLELWDDLIYCYRLLDKKSAAVDLIKARLNDTPNDPRLWCSLGDVTNTDAYYEKALEVSNDRSARAKRSLARSAYNRGDYMKSKTLWESALALNSLYPDGWFALGAAALKAQDIDKAIDAFTRAVQLDPENGEAWNNIACLHMIKKRSKESFIAFKEALKFRRSSWQLWENFSHVAMDVENFTQALEATRMVFDLTENKRVDAELLDKIMLIVEGRTSKSIEGSTDCVGDNCGSKSLDESGYQEGNERSRETELLINMIGNILQQVIRTGGSENIWGLYARWHKIKGNLTMCAEALLKQVRSYQGSDLWRDVERFRKFARASLQLCRVYMEIASSTGSRRELTTAEMHLRNCIKQGGEFADTEEFRDLQSCLDEISGRLAMPEESS